MIFKSGQSLYNFLKDKLYQGNLRWPRCLDGEELLKTMLEFPMKDRLYCKQVIKSNSDDVMKFKNIGINFYRDSFIPNLLARNKITPGTSFYKIAEQELDACIKSNASQMILNESTGEAVGIMANYYWSIRDGFEPFKFDPVEWMNISGDIANECAKSFEEAGVIFRNYQMLAFLHMHGHATHSLGKSECLTCTGVWIDPGFRQTGAVGGALRSTKKNRREEIVVGGQGTWAASKKAMISSGLSEFGQVPFADISWRFQGEHVFESLRNQGGITYNFS